MRKWIWKLSLFLTVAMVLESITAGMAAAVCGTGPPLPTEGLAWPVAGTVSQGWSLDCGTDRGHRGIDIAAPSGSAVTAAASGVVTFVGYTPAEGGGTTVSITHPGGLRSTYLHLTAVAISEGENISQGQPIGEADGRALHFGLKLPGERESYFNPLDFLPGPPTSPESSAEVLPPLTSPAAETAPVTGPTAADPRVAVVPVAIDLQSPAEAPQAIASPLPLTAPGITGEAAANPLGEAPQIAGQAPVTGIKADWKLPRPDRQAASGDRTYGARSENPDESPEDQRSRAIRGLATAAAIALVMGTGKASGLLASGRRTVRSSSGWPTGPLRLQ